jgi:Domain of unknown function (DUF4956)
MARAARMREYFPVPVSSEDPLPSASPSKVSDHLEQNILLRVAVYYVILFGAALLAWRYLPASILPQLPMDSTSGLGGSGLPSKKQLMSTSSINPATLTVNVAVAMIAALLLVLPVAWIYILTRHKKGYEQSVVQSMIILSPIAAGVIVMVKYNLALAFGLTGVLAAIRFRNTLDDSKDAVYVFVATALGLAAAVELPAAAVLSLIFNAMILALWYTDFGRVPAPLEGARAQKRIDKAMAQMRKTGSFVAMLDDQIFRDMSPEQLELTADRAWRRKRRHSNEPVSADDMARREVLLRVQADDTDAARPSIEETFDQWLKKWRLGGVVRDGGGNQSLEYAVQFKKSAEPDELLRALRELPHVVGAEIK